LRDFWRDKKVLVTGHTGFKGAWLSFWLQELGAQVAGVALSPEEESLFSHLKLRESVDSTILDIMEKDTLHLAVEKLAPDIVIHMAAQPLVRRSYRDPIETFTTNVIGTANLLNACREVGTVKAILNVTTDKCYENKEWDWPYRESDNLGGWDPYSASKACSEIVTTSFRNSYFKERDVAVATARAGNVIGGGDYSEERLIPDVLRAVLSGRPIVLRNPGAIRPWQHVLDPLRGYMTLIESMHNDPVTYSEPWNFGPNESDALTVQSVCEEILNHMNVTLPIQTVGSDLHETKILKLDASKAKANLDWKPRWSVQTAIAKVADWHKRHESGENASSICRSQIQEYEQLLE
jgi:CDP-glucose 4,6-dehydratase